MTLPGTPRTPDSVAAIIPTYNRRNRLRRTLDPVLADPDLDEIVVVVDGCTDGSFELLERLGLGEPRLRPLLIENSGAKAAILAGAEYASADVVVALDDDVIATSGLFAGHLRHHRARPRLVVVGYMKMPPQQWRPGSFVREGYREAYEAQCEQWERDPSTVLRRFWMGNVSFRREDLLRVGPPAGREYNSDRDLGLRCLRSGLEGVFDRTLVGMHEYERSLDGMLADARSLGRGSVILEREHPQLIGERERRIGQARVPIRLILRLCRVSDFAARAVSGMSVVLVRVAGRLRVPRLERRAGSLLKRVEQERGALEVERGRGS